MTKKMTIVEAAQVALRNIGRPAKVNEIYNEIISMNLYAFNTPTPEHVLRTTIRRQTSNVKRVDSYDTALFYMLDDDQYWFIKIDPT